MKTASSGEAWRSSMPTALLRRRAELLSSLRMFFASRDVIEVEVPVIGTHTVTDPYIQAISCRIGGVRHFLQTSPEYFMKRLLAGGAPSMYYLGKAFRQDESGDRHNAEFTMLEWYRLGLDDHGLMAELSDLIRYLMPEVVTKKITYGRLFEAHLGVDPYAANAQELAALAYQEMDLHAEGFDSSDKNLWLDLLFSHFVEPKLQSPTIVYNYPASQCALAKVVDDQNSVPKARRFELFWKGIELANGYWELSDADVQKRRFDDDLNLRQKAGLPTPPVDQNLLAAMDEGLPECAGIALGVDRLFMCLESLPSIAHTMPFPLQGS